MNKTYLLLSLFVFGILSISGFTQNRNYLLHTDVNISRLKNQIAKDDSIKANWEEQYSKAEGLLNSK